MKKGNAAINIAGLLLDTKHHTDLFQQPIYETFICRNKNKNRDSGHFSVWKNGRCPYFSTSDGKLIPYAYSQLLASNHGMLLHATAVVKDKKVFIFLGVGGAGKSTIAGLSKRYKVLGDDIIAARKIGGHYYAFSTPWKQAPFIRPGRYAKGRISAIFFIKKSDKISFKTLQPEYALMRMLSSHIHFLIYTKRSLAKKIFFTAADFTKKIPAYEMEFEKTRNFWRELNREIRIARS